MKRHYNEWEIEPEGGYITIKRFRAEKCLPNGRIIWHWAFRLKECKALCDKRDNGEEIDSLYLKSLY